MMEGWVHLAFRRAETFHLGEEKAWEDNGNNGERARLLSGVSSVARRGEIRIN